MEAIRVSSSTDSRRLAGAVAAALRRHGKVVLQACGPKACHAAVKGIAVARGLTAPEGADLKFAPRFEREGEMVVVVFEVFWR